MKGKTVSAVQAAIDLQMELDYVYKLLRMHKLDGEKVDGEWRVSKKAIEERISGRAA